MADKHPGTEKTIDPTQVPINNAPEEQGEGGEPFIEDDEEQEETESRISDNTDPSVIDTSKLSKEEKLALIKQLEEETITAPTGPSGISDSHAVTADEAHGERAIAMRDYLSKCKRVMFIIPRKEGEPPNVVETVIMNGYRFNIKKGEFVDLPLPVAEILRASYAHTMNDNQPYLIANVGQRLDEVTGQPKDPSRLL